ncbi:SMX1 [Cyberlindnera jadinii]|uniref:SMX1 protein n=1 Tax=Cyberlindnera jadinii (strain ATCC 18201 / CBS 1600 / BCRC 20928 / JCM 3617 / NBRC 0987 / NRRL Y-1542) TaxID=983966 RepID=A0A0H5C9C1_CYBJN|nr:SMX1 [Cyberlindnera jadinii]
MERQHILDVLSGTLDPNPQIRKQAENELTKFESQPGFTLYCLDLCVDESVSLSQRSSAAVFFKNRVAIYWNSNSSSSILEPEREQIKVKLIESLIKAHNDNHIRPQLSTSVKLILDKGEWVLNEQILSLLNSTSNQVHVYTGLLLLLEVVRSLKYTTTDQSRAPLNLYVDQTFPILEKLAPELINRDDYQSGEMLYFILKIFKFVTLMGMPYYLANTNNLSNWISIHLMVVQKPTPQSVLELDPSDRVLDRRVKCNKWGFGNLQRFYYKFATPKSQFATPEFVDFFTKNYAPEILKVYFGVVEKWGSGTWVSEPALYNLITFIERCIIYDSWSLIQPHFTTLLRHLLFPCLCQRDLELYETDPEEYIRRFFDINRETSTADVAAVDVLFVIAHHRFEEVNNILTLLNDIFNKFTEDQSLENALKAEGGLRILGSISPSLYREESPLKPQVDQIIDGFIVPLLTGKYEFLRARACETISLFDYKYNDKNVLSRVFQGVFENFKNNESLPIQIEAANALKVLIADPLVSDAIRAEVPQIVQKLMSLSKEFELDMLSEIMEYFVEFFPDELQPFAREMGQSLCQQFVQIATEIIEITNSGGTNDAITDKEYQGIAVINTMITMAVTIPKVDFDEVFFPAIEFVVQNAAINFLAEAMELLDSLILNKKQVTQQAWAMFQQILESFGTYAGEYFDYYNSIFEDVILYGFRGLNSQSPQVHALQTVLHELLESQIDYGEQGTFELIEYLTITLREINSDFALVLKTFREQDLSPYYVLKVFLASLYANPAAALQTTESFGETVRLLEIWYNLTPMLEKVYGLRLQIAALISLLTAQNLPNTLTGFLPQLSEKLAQTIGRLPEAISKKAKLNSDEYLGSEDSEFDDDEAFRNTPMDYVDIAPFFAQRLQQLQQVDASRYELVMTNLKSNIDVLTGALQYSDDSKSH